MILRLLTATFFTGALLASSGCEPPLDEEPLACRNPDPGIAQLGVGNVDSGFQQMVDGGDLPIVLGPQGKHMVVVSLQIRNLEPPSAGSGRSTVSISLAQDGQIVGGFTGDVSPTSVVGETTQYLGLRVVFTHNEPLWLTGRGVHITARVKDGCGRTLTDLRALRLTT